MTENWKIYSTASSLFSADKPGLVSLNIPTNKVCAGTAVTFTCLAGAANPPIQNYTLNKFVDGLTYISSNKVGVFNQRLYTKGQYNYTCKAGNSVGHTSSITKAVEVQSEFNG